VLISIAVTSLTACPWNENPEQTTTDGGTSNMPDLGDNFSRIREMVMNEDKHLLVYNKTESLSFAELVLAQAFQDIYARTNARGDSLDPLQTGTFDVILTIGGETKTVMSNVTLRGVSGTETVTVNGDGWQCFAIPLSQYFPNYRGQSCEMKIVVHSGGTGIRLDQVTFKDRLVDPAIDQSNVDVYNNTFDETTEDWMLGEQYKTSQYYWWSTIDRENLEPTGTIQIDCSDGGGDEKRNGNTNIWMAKHYVLPESNDITIKFKVGSDEETGAKIKVSLYVDGKYFVLYDWQAARPSYNNMDVSINLSELDSSIDFSGKEVTVIFEARDGGQHNGVGEACKLYDFQTISK